MDFGSILHVAQKNEKLPKKEIKYYSTKFDPPKKEERSKQLSSNIKKFLARKEAEEKKKSVEANAKREELLALRSQDKKATRRVSVMLKRTKSANKSVIQDAVDNDNTAVTLAGPSQPDEDDYGYVSQEASAYYNKMMQKYNNMPEDSKFAKSKRSVSVNLNGTKDRVRAALLREQEEALLPHKRKRRPKDDDISNDTYNDDDYRSEQSQERSSTKSKPRAAAPPPINFSELLKLAEKKQFEPIKIEPKKEVKEEERPMTKRQKRELEKEKAWRERKEKGITNGGDKESVPGASRSSDKTMGPPNKIPKLNNGTQSNGKIPKVPSAEERSKNGQRPAQASQNIPRRADDKPGNARRDDRDRIKDERDRLRDEMERMRMERDRLRDERDKIRDDRDRLKNDDRNTVRKSDNDRGRVTSNGINHSSSTDRRPDPSKASKLRQELEKSRSLSKTSSRPPGSTQLANQNTNKAQLNKQTAAKVTSALDKSKGLPRRDITVKDMKARQLIQGQDRPKQFPPADLKPKQFPPPDVRRRQFPSKDVKRKSPMGHKRRIIDDDDSEYDSEMDDFIDDGPEEGEDYSKYISEIFGYDKSRYRNVDEMDDNMESSFSQVMKEEFISGKLGLMEDLEDMKQEAEEKKRKQERMKKFKK
ncbi:uncharacterized protein CBL_01363 [Carabus blaptoides fortunei]